MPRRARNPGAGKAPVNTPASGAGWGGPAKGGGERSAAPFGPGNPGIGPQLPGAGRGKKPTQKSIDRAAEAEKSFAKLVHIRDEGDTTQLQGWAADRIIQHVEGAPRQRQENTGADGGPMRVVYGWATDA